MILLFIHEHSRWWHYHSKSFDSRPVFPSFHFLSSRLSISSALFRKQLMLPGFKKYKYKNKVRVHIQVQTQTQERTHAQDPTQAHTYIFLISFKNVKR